MTSFQILLEPSLLGGCLEATFVSFEDVGSQYRGTSLTMGCTPLGPYSRPIYGPAVVRGEGGPVWARYSVLITSSLLLRGPQTRLAQA